MIGIRSCSLYHNCRLIQGPRIYPAHCCETIFSGEIRSEKSVPVPQDGIDSNGFPSVLVPFAIETGGLLASLMVLEHGY